MSLSKERQKSEPEPSAYRWVIVLTAFFTFVTFAFSFQLAPPLFRALIDEFALTEAEVSLLMSIVVIPGVVLALPAGLLVNRFGFRPIGVVSTILITLGPLITATATTYPMVILGRFILGVGGTFIVVGVPTVIPQWFAGRDLGKAMGIYSVNMPVATILAFPAATVLAGNRDWRYPFFAGAVLAVIGVVLFAVAMKEGPLKGENRPASLAEVKSGLKVAEIWKTSLVWMLFNITAIAFLSWGPTIFRDYKGFDALSASVLPTALMYAALVCVPLFGWTSDRSRRRKPFMVAGSVLVGLVLNVIAYSEGATLVLSVVLLGVVAAMVPPIVMTVAAGSLPPNQSSAAFSVVTLCQNAGTALSAPVAGYILQTTGSVEWTFLGVSLFAFVGAVLALSLKTK